MKGLLILIIWISVIYCNQLQRTQDVKSSIDVKSSKDVIYKNECEKMIKEIDSNTLYLRIVIENETFYPWKNICFTNSKEKCSHKFDYCISLNFDPSKNDKIVEQLHVIDLPLDYSKFNGDSDTSLSSSDEYHMRVNFCAKMFYLCIFRDGQYGVGYDEEMDHRIQQLNSTFGMTKLSWEMKKINIIELFIHLVPVFCMFMFFTSLIYFCY